MGTESQHSQLARPLKDSKPGKPGGKEAKTAAGGAAGTGGAGPGAAEDDKGKAVAPEVLPVESPPEVNTDRETFILFGALFEATMIDRKIGDKPISFEFSLGNYGNILESAGQASSSSSSISITSPSPSVVRKARALAIPDVMETLGSTPIKPLSPSSLHVAREPQDAAWTSRSTTPPEKPLVVEGNRFYMYLPLEKQKPCVHVMSFWEERTYRLYNSNILDNMAVLFEEGVARATELNRKSDPEAELHLRTVLQDFCMDARSFIMTTEAKLKAELKSSYLTHLDKKRLTLCKQELESMVGEVQTLSERKKKSGGIKKMLKDAMMLIHRLRFLVEEVLYADRSEKI
ncbi:hypothetical protein LDENG_00080210 [Lucifuga dentata]|nr:hypothetical protein LDENG_00080210 [Lucifuga dentata]